MLTIDNDLKDIVISAMSYALGRRTMMPITFTSYVREHPELIDDRIKYVLLRDLHPYLNNWDKGKHTDDVDHDNWKDFTEWLENLEVE